MDELISVIIPIYGVENYLINCIESVRNQTYKNLEIILVDDESPDNCAAICDKYVEKDTRIKVIHKLNGGLSDARNAGLDMATGEYIAFVDGDDTLNKDTLEILLEIIHQYGTYIAKNKFRDVTDSRIPEEQCIDKETLKINLIKGDEYIKKFCTYQTSCSFCDKLFKREVFERYRFKKGRTNEDLLLLSTILMENTYDIVEVDYAGYNYLQRENSITKTTFGKSVTDTVYNCIELVDASKKIQSKLSSYFIELTLYQIRTFFILMPDYYIKSENEDYRVAYKFIIANKSKIMRAFFSLKDKCFLVLFCLNPLFAKKIINCWRKRKNM